MMTFKEAYENQRRLWEEAEADLLEVIEFLHDLYRRTNNPEIVEFFKTQGIPYYDGR